MFLEDAWYELKDLVDDLNVVVLKVVLFAELVEGCETGVGNAENCVTVAWDHLTVLEAVPCVFGELLISWNTTELLAYVDDEAQTFLIGKSVKGAGQSAHCSADAVVRIAEC